MAIYFTTSLSIRILLFPDFFLSVLEIKLKKLEHVGHDSLTGLADLTVANFLSNPCINTSAISRVFFWLQLFALNYFEISIHKVGMSLVTILFVSSFLLLRFFHKSRI